MARKEQSQTIMDNQFTAVHIWFACVVAGTRLKDWRWIQPPISLLFKHDCTTALQVHTLASMLHAATTTSGKVLMDKAAGDREFLRHRGAPGERAPLNSQPLSHLRAIPRYKLLKPPP